MLWRRKLWSVAVGIGIAVGCSSSDDTGSGDDNLDTDAGSDASAGSGGTDVDGQATGGTAGGSGTGGASATGGGGASATGGVAGTDGAPGTGGGIVVVFDGGCGSTQCTNCMDDDGDGEIDSADFECTGALDNDEATFATGIPGDNRDDCQDCFFDGDSGQGNDGCAYPAECLLGENPPATGGSDCSDCAVSERCINYCKASTPNGCDCFGCCEFDTASGTIYALLAPTCNLDSLNDTTACPRCTQSADCTNECDECELCLGKTTLPASCFPDAGTGGAGGTAGTGGSGGSCPTPACASDAQPCGLDCLSACPSGKYCLTGCCTTIPM